MRQHLGGELGARAHADEVHVRDLVEQLLPFQRAGQQLHVGVIRRSQGIHRALVYAFEQQELDFAFVQGRLGHDALPIVMAPARRH